MSQNKLSLSPTEQIVQVVNEIGLKGAAKHYLTSPATLSRWLRKQNYCIRRIYVKVEKTA